MSGLTLITFNKISYFVSTVNFRSARHRASGDGDGRPNNVMHVAASIFALIRTKETHSHQLHQLADAAAGTSVFQRPLPGCCRARVACGPASVVRGSNTGQRCKRSNNVVNFYTRISHNSTYMYCRTSVPQTL